MKRPVRKKCPAAAGTAGSGGDSIQRQPTGRERFLQALDDHPYRERLLVQPDLFLRTIPEYRRRQNGIYLRGAGRHQISDLRPEFDGLRDRIAVLERQLLDLVNVMGS